MELVMTLLGLFILLAYFVMRKGTPIWVSLPIVGFMFYIASAIFFSVDSYLSWPMHDQKLAERTEFAFLAYYAIRPTKDTKGTLYIWVRPFSKLDDEFTETPKEQSFTDKVLAFIDPRTIFAYLPHDEQMPRAFWLRYSEALDEALQRGEQALAEGATVKIRLGGKADSAELGKEGEGSGEVSESTEDDGLLNSGQEQQLEGVYDGTGVEINLPPGISKQ
jgi:hypothetical protein